MKVVLSHDEVLGACLRAVEAKTSHLMELSGTGTLTEKSTEDETAPRALLGGLEYSVEVLPVPINGVYVVGDDNS